MNRKVYLPEIFQMMEEAPKRADKLQILKRYAALNGLKEIMFYCYDPRVKFVVTRKEIENLWYDHMDIPDYDMSPTVLFNEVRRIKNYTNLKQPPVKHSRVLILIANMFSVLHHEEIEIFKQMVDGKIKIKGVTPKFVNEVWPNLVYIEPKKKKASKPKKEKKNENDDSDDNNTTVDV